jgi:UDP-N-acetylglucosamine 2-epimerase (non-hydrolysing)
MTKFEKIILKYKPDLVLVYGDVNSTLAASVVCSKTLINGKPVPVAHVEAGLRSFDLTMPEEINRIVTDSLADYLFVPEESGMKNLIKAGISRSKIFFTGNIMIDSLKGFIKQASKSKVLEYLSVSKKEYVLITLHRPSNVDSKQSTLEIIDIFKSINRISGTLDIVFPVHPRTLKMFENFGLNSALESIHNLILTEPLGYIDFLSLIHNSKFVITDSGGIQEETSYLGIPCLTIRDNTERPVTITQGTNILCGKDKLMIEKEVRNIINGRGKKGGRIKYYDGKTAGRIAMIILKNILSVY